MGQDPSTMDRVEILRKVLEINPHLKVGDDTAEMMTEHLIASIRESRRPPRFSDEKFMKVFRGMLGELESDLDRDLLKLDREQRTLSTRVKGLQEGLRERLIQFLVAASPGPLSDEAKLVLRKYGDVLAAIGAPIRTLDHAVRERSASVEI